jgi:hypothetical protein
MAAMGKEHPLNIFKQQGYGFDTATRDRRTLPGKVVASAPRARPVAPIIAAARKERGERAAPAPATGRPRANRMLLYSVLVVAGGLVLYVAGAAASGPALKSSSEEVFSTAAASGDFTILAADYPGSESNRNLAVAVRDMLRNHGLPEVRVLGYPPITEGVHSRYTVLVGSGRTAGALKDVLSRLRAVTGPIGDPAPFRDAKLIEAPPAP